jgi:hypothetical protein
MRNKPKPPRQAKRVTKSIRLTPQEAYELGRLVEGTAYAEAALLRQWVLAGMQQFRIAEAIRAHQEGHVDVRAAAERARLPVAVLLEEMAARKVAVLADAEPLVLGLRPCGGLRRVSVRTGRESQRSRDAVQRLRSQAQQTAGVAARPGAFRP